MQAATIERDNLVRDHDNLARWVVRQFLRSGLDPDDLLQEARIGLLKASRRFDPSRGVKFATYARLWVQGAVRDFVRHHRPESQLGDIEPAAEPESHSPAEAERILEALNFLPKEEAAVLRLLHGLEEDVSPALQAKFAPGIKNGWATTNELNNSGRRNLGVILATPGRRGVIHRFRVGEYEFSFLGVLDRSIREYFCDFISPLSRDHDERREQLWAIYEACSGGKSRPDGYDAMGDAFVAWLTANTPLTLLGVLDAGYLNDWEYLDE